MAMRLSTRTSPRSSSTTRRFLNPTRTSMMEDDRGSENSHPGLQLNIPHHQQQQPKRHSFQKPNRRRRSSSPSTISTSARKSLQDDEAAMLQYLNQSHRRKASMPETWSVKLPAYHQSSMPKQQTKRTKSKPQSMFRGNSSGVSLAVANSMEEDDTAWLAERREPFATIDEKDKRKWNPLRPLMKRISATGGSDSF